MKIQMETYGCSANMNDAEIMRGLLEQEHDISEDSPVVIVNTCTVKGPTERKILRSIQNHVDNNKRIIITGCMAEAQSKMLLERFPDVSILGPDHIDKISSTVKKDENIVLIGKTSIDKAALTQIPQNTISGIIQISRGCDSACTYCITKAAKGHISSYPEKSILERARMMIMQGKKEIWLTSQDNTAFGVEDNGVPRLSRLIKRLSRIEGDFMIRNGMGNPHNLLLFCDDLIESYKNEKVYRFLHLPVQSGSDKILSVMRRQYTVEDFKKIVFAFRKEFPDITISTDIIYGYPDESENDFNQTLELMKELRFDIVNISRFWPRPGTYASRLSMLPKEVLKDRGIRITNRFRQISKEKNSSWVGWKGKIMVCEKGKKDSMIGRNYAYKTIALTSKELERTKDSIVVGSEVIVEIIGYDTFHLKARVLDVIN